MPINGFLYPGAKVVKPYSVANSLRLDGTDDHLSRTLTQNGTSQRAFTFSCWIKRSKRNSDVPRLLHMGGSGGSPTHYISVRFRDDQNGRLSFYTEAGGSGFQLNTDALFRDTTGWMHIVVAVNSEATEESDRQKMYVNGTQVTSFSSTTAMSQNADLNHNQTNDVIYLFRKQQDSDHFPGYAAEVVFIDGQQLAPTSFGEFDNDSSTIWKPIDVSGLTFGTNGFYLDFEDSSALGNDVSGNNNDFNTSLAGATSQSTDTCTNNFATYNALLSQVAGVDGRHSSWNGQLAEGDLSSGTAVDNYNNQFSTFGLTSGKWYAEFKMSTTDNNFSHGIVNDVFFSGLGSYIGQSTASGVQNIGYYCQNGQVLKNNSTQYTGSTYGVSGTDVISIALDLDNNYVYFAKNGTYQNSGNPASGSSGTGGVAIDADTTWFLGSTTHSLSSSGLKISYANFGSPPTGFTISSGNADANGHGNFEYSVPSGYFALCSKNLAEFG